MSNTNYNPNDPHFLLSRSFDERLLDEQREALEQWLADEPGAGAEKETFQRLLQLIHQWSLRPLDMEDKRFLETTLARIADEAERSNNTESSETPKTSSPMQPVGVTQADRVLNAWAKREVEADWDVFTESVMARVKTEDKARRMTGVKVQAKAPSHSWTHKLVFRIGAPLAAAAAIVLAVTIGTRTPQNFGPVVNVSLGLVSSGSHTTGASSTESAPTTTTSTVLFRRDTVKVVNASASRRNSGVGYAIAGVAPVQRTIEDAPPL